MDIHEIKARMKTLGEQLQKHNDETKDALEEARSTGKGLVGDTLAKFERADAGIDRCETELEALDKQLKAARGETTIVGAGRKQARMGQRLDKDQRFGDIKGDNTDRSHEIGEYLRNIALRAQGVGVDTAGGFTVPEVLSTNLWDLARDKTVSRDAGVSFVPLDGPGDVFKLPKVTGDATPTWVAEHAQIPEDELQVGIESLTPKKLALIVRVSRELVQDSSQEIGSVITDTVSSSFARVIDEVIMNGTGGAEPLGIRNFAGIPETLAVGVPTWSTLTAAKLAIEEANYDPSAFVMAPRTMHTLTEQREDGATGAYLAPPTSLDGISRLSTNMVPTDLGVGTDESFILGGDFSQAIAGVRLDLQVMPLMERYADTYEIGYVFAYRLDTTVMRTAAFMKLEGVTA